MKVDFYILPHPTPSDCVNFTCALAGKAYQQGYRITIQPNTPEAAKTLDAALWATPPDSFIPHTITPQNHTIDIPTQNAQETLCITLLSNTMDTTQYDRIAHIVPNQPDHKNAARDAFRTYKKLGAEINTHNL